MENADLANPIPVWLRSAPADSGEWYAGHPADRTAKLADRLNRLFGGFTERGRAGMPD